MECSRQTITVQDVHLGKRCFESGEVGNGDCFPSTFCESGPNLTDTSAVRSHCFINSVNVALGFVEKGVGFEELGDFADGGFILRRSVFAASVRAALDGLLYGSCSDPGV